MANVMDQELTVSGNQGSKAWILRLSLSPESSSLSSACTCRLQTSASVKDRTLRQRRSSLGSRGSAGARSPRDDPLGGGDEALSQHSSFSRISPGRSSNPRGRSRLGPIPLSPDGGSCLLQLRLWLYMQYGHACTLSMHCSRQRPLLPGRKRALPQAG